MKRVMLGAVAVLAVGCAGSRPAVAFRSAEPAARPAPALVTKAPTAIVAQAVSGQSVAHVPAPAAAPAPAAPAPAATPISGGPEAEACAHMLKHIGEASQLYEVRASAGSPESKTAAAASYLDAMIALDPKHPDLPHGLKLRIAVVSGMAAKGKSLAFDGDATEDEIAKTGEAFASSIQAVGDYCTPFVVVLGEES